MHSQNHMQYYSVWAVCGGPCLETPVRTFSGPLPPSSRLFSFVLTRLRRRVLVSVPLCLCVCLRLHPGSLSGASIPSLPRLDRYPPCSLHTQFLCQGLSVSACLSQASFQVSDPHHGIVPSPFEPPTLKRGGWGALQRELCVPGAK